jgi:hypothetical protein
VANPSKDKGTWWESRTVRWLAEQTPFRNARRNVLAGRRDPGDVDPVPIDPPPIIISCKNGYGGQACITCNHIRDVHPDTAQWKNWWADLQRTAERRNPAALTLLCVKREGRRDPEFAHWYVDAFHLGGHPRFGPVKITGAQAKVIMLDYCNRYGVEW